MRTVLGITKKVMKEFLDYKSPIRVAMWTHSSANSELIFMNYQRAKCSISVKISYGKGELFGFLSFFF